MALSDIPSVTTESNNVFPLSANIVLLANGDRYDGDKLLTFGIVDFP